MAAKACRRCGGDVVQKPLLGLAGGGALMLAADGVLICWAPIWPVVIILGLTGLYLLIWATAGCGRWCRGCKRFDGV
jgi:hypothetical protein